MILGLSSSPFSYQILAEPSPNHSRPRITSIPIYKSNKSNRSNMVLHCSSSSNGTSKPSSDNNDSKVVLDAFFLGKAFAEALNERIGSTVGEVLSVVGQWQAEQQKQVKDFELLVDIKNYAQEEVLERAKRAKEKAALEAMDDHTVISKTAVSTPVTPPSFRGPTTADPFKQMLND